MYSYQFFNLDENTYGFNLICDGTIIQFYDNDPNIPGELMTFEIAELRAIEIVNRLNNPIPSPEEINIPEILPIKDEDTSSYIFGPVEFLNRFTSTELNKLLLFEEQIRQQYQVGVSNNNLDENIQNLNQFFVMWNKATEVNLKYPVTILGITTICNILGFEQTRINEILGV